MTRLAFRQAWNAARTIIRAIPTGFAEACGRYDGTP